LRAQQTLQAPRLRVKRQEPDMGTRHYMTRAACAVPEPVLSILQQE
jgi:hypothetical protein